ncbi:MAG: peptide chain release factor N(5)-glutamine methyltransferase [Lachnospiraceae bacterium]|nr:peptide chain release factor N(5)-glutamine methyltransferase [Lachnospiraceae bacterium]MDY4096273.1 peptide chain release factor N(5)-glutamine methyltransferase [Lachnospiraceae bacterium]
MEYKEAYRWGAEELSQAGIEESRLDARLLLEYVCHTDRNTLLAHGDRRVEQEEQKRFEELIARRKARVPLQQLTGVQEFMGLEFQVDEHVLIPRQDTECLVEEVMRFSQDGNRILDMCTGSGCILLSLLHYSNACKGVGADISPEALRVAHSNACRIEKLERPVPWEKDTVRFVESDLFSRIPDEKFDLIVSNPPYIASSVIPTLMEEVKNHEPLLALDGKEDGLFFYGRIIEESRAFLAKEGRLFFEIGFDQGEAVSNLMKKAGFDEVTVVKDLAGLDRVVHGIWMG